MSEPQIRVDDVLKLAQLKAAGLINQEEAEELLDLLAVESDD
jgi:hypothetical protein